MRYYCVCHLSPVSLPRLVDFDWRVDVKISSDSVARMAQPTCLVQMKVSMISLQDNVLSLNFRLHPTL